MTFQHWLCSLWHCVTLGHGRAWCHHDCHDCHMAIHDCHMIAIFNEAPRLQLPNQTNSRAIECLCQFDAFRWQTKWQTVHRLPAVKLQLSHGLNWLNTVERHASSCWFACYCSPQSLSKVRFVSKCLEISWNVLNLQSTDQSTLFLLCFVMNAKWCTSASAARPVGSCGGRATGSRCPCVKRNVPGVTVALPHQNMSKTKLLYSTTILPSFYKNVFWKILSSLSSSSTLFLQIQLSANVPCLVSSPHKVKTNDSMITQWRKLDYESRNLWMTYAKNNMERMKELTRDREKGLSCTSLSQEKASLCTSDQLACFPIYYIFLNLWINVDNTNWQWRTWCQWCCAESAVHLVVLPSRRLSRTNNSKYNTDGTKASQFQHVLVSRYRGSKSFNFLHLIFFQRIYGIYCFNHSRYQETMQQCNIKTNKTWAWHVVKKRSVAWGGLVPTSFSIVHHELQAFRIGKAKHLPVLARRSRMKCDDVRRMFQTNAGTFESLQIIRSDKKSSFML